MKHFLFTAWVGMAAMGCAGRNQEPTVVSSASAVSYAMRYPDTLDAATTQLAADKAEAQRLTSALPARQGDLQGDPELLRAILKAADDAGRGEAYGDAAREATLVRRFIDEERGAIGARITASAQKQLSEGSCQNVDIGGTVSFALKDGADKQLEKRLRASNEAHLLIERHKAALGNAKAQALQKLADDVALASYLVNVALLEDRNRCEHLVHEKGSVERTLEDAIQDERQFQVERAKNDADKRASAQRSADLQQSKDGLAAPVLRAELQLKDLDEQLEQARKDYDAAFDTLLKSLPSD